MKRVCLCAAVFLLLSLPFAAAQENAAGAANTGVANDNVAEEQAEAESPASATAEAGLSEDDAVSAAVAGDDVPAIYTHIENVVQAIGNMASGDSRPRGFLTRLLLALGILVIQALLIWLVWLLFKFLSKKIADSAGDKIKPLTIKKFKLLTAKQITSAILFCFRILKYVITALQLFLALPIVFSLFPSTRHFAVMLFGYIFNPLKNIFWGAINYIPNLFTIIVIIVITRYAIKALKFLSTQIARGKLVIPGFYEDWAAPTYKILQVLLWAFTVALVYPYLPGSDSKVFQGVSVFVGIVFSLGSSSAIGNLVAGLVITYMRSFKIGDRVKINDSTGFVVEKTLMVVRLKTHKNEYVTFPNLTILNSAIINYNTSSDEDEEGLILNTEVTVGYETPWETIHELLINAALATDSVQKRPKPFVLQTSLDDFYARYQVNCYTKEVDKVPKIYAQLYENIQNAFREAGLDLTSPHYEISVSRKE